MHEVGLPESLRIHDLRHTCASLHLQHGATVREVMEIHGWRQMQTALRYLHTTGSLNAAADRLSAARADVIGARLRPGRAEPTPRTAAPTRPPRASASLPGPPS